LDVIGRIKNTSFRQKKYLKYLSVAKSTQSYMRRETNLCLMPEAENHVSAPTSDNDDGYYNNYYENYADLAVNLLTHYSFDLSGSRANELVARWQVEFPLNWLHLAVVEALYQGRYKAISVQQILNMWLRRGQASFHFNMEFERLICSKFPQCLTASTTSTSSLALPPVSRTSSNLVQTNNIQNTNTQNTNIQSKSHLLQDKKDTSSAVTNDSTLDKSQYKQQQTDTKPEWATVRRPPIPNIEVVNEPQSRVAIQLVKMLPATHHSAIEQFTPETTEVSESFASKLKSIAGAESAEC
jgi:hypothetical protein